MEFARTPSVTATMPSTMFQSTMTTPTPSRAAPVCPMGWQGAGGRCLDESSNVDGVALVVAAVLTLEVGLFSQADLQLPTVNANSPASSAPNRPSATTDMGITGPMRFGPLYVTAWQGGRRVPRRR